MKNLQVLLLKLTPARLMCLPSGFQNSEAEIHLGESIIPRSLHDIAVQMHLRKIKFSIFSRYFLDDEEDPFDEESDDVKVLPQLQATLEKNVREMLCSSESEFPPDETEKEAVVSHFTPSKKNKKDSSDEESDTTQNVVVHVHSLDRIFEGISDSQLAQMFNTLIYKNGNSGCVLCPNGDIVITDNERDGKLWVDWENQYCG